MISRETRLDLVVILTVAAIVLSVNPAASWGMEMKTLSVKSVNRKNGSYGSIRSYVVGNAVENSSTNSLNQTSIKDFEKMQARPSLMLNALIAAYLQSEKNSSSLYYYRASESGMITFSDQTLSPHKETVPLEYDTGSRNKGEFELNSGKETVKKSVGAKLSTYPKAVIVMDMSPALSVIIAFMGILLIIFGSIIKCMCDNNHSHKHDRASTVDKQFMENDLYKY